MSAKRYRLREMGYPLWTDMAEDPDGDYVLHSDYAATERERDKLAQEVMRLVNINEQLHERYNALREAVANYFALQETKGMKCVDDMDSTEYTTYYALLSLARAEVDRLLGES